jgi:hypothetical protein
MLCVAAPIECTRSVVDASRMGKQTFLTRWDQKRRHPRESMIEADMIQKAIAAHANWKANLREAVDTGKFEGTAVSVKRDNRCEFGKWLYGPDFSAAERQTEDYRAVIDLHAKFHQEAAKIVELVNSGQQDAADEAMTLRSSYNRASCALTKELLRWRHHLPDVPCWLQGGVEKRGEKATSKLPGIRVGDGRRKETISVETIQKAIAAHANWKVRLRTAFNAGKFDVTPAVVALDDQCEFGKWLRGPDFSASEKQSEDYRKVVDLHARFHQEAARIVELATSGRSKEAEAAMGLESGYSRASSALTRELIKWRLGLQNRGCQLSSSFSMVP